MRVANLSPLSTSNFDAHVSFLKESLCCCFHVIDRLVCCSYSTGTETYAHPILDMQKEIRDYADYIGLDLGSYPELTWIAEEGLHSPIPKEWSVVKNGDGHYFQNNVTGVTQPDHPMDEHYRRLSEREMNRVASDRKRDAAQREERAQEAAAAQQQREREQQRRQEEEHQQREQLRRKQQQRLEEQLVGTSANYYASAYSDTTTPTRDMMRARVAAATATSSSDGHHDGDVIDVPSTSRRVTPAAAAPVATAHTQQNEDRNRLVVNNGGASASAASVVTTSTAAWTGRAQVHTTVDGVTSDRGDSRPRTLRFWAYLFLGCLLMHSIVANTVLNTQLASSPSSGTSSGVSGLADALQRLSQNRVFIVKPTAPLEPQPTQKDTPSTNDTTVEGAAKEQGVANAAVPPKTATQVKGKALPTGEVDEEEDAEGWFW